MRDDTPYRQRRSIDDITVIGPLPEDPRAHYVICGGENIMHVIYHGIPNTHRASFDSEERSSRPVFLRKADARSTARKMQEEGGRWHNRVTAIVTFYPENDEVVFTKRMDAVGELLKPIPTTRMSMRVEFLPVAC
jgi:hypothetical protein